MKSLTIQIFYAFVLLIVVSWFIIIYINEKLLFEDKEYKTFNTTKIPNTVHYVTFDIQSITFPWFLSLVSVLKIQKPEAIWLHTNKINFYGDYYVLIRKLSRLTNVSIIIQYTERPTHTYGKPLSSVYHASDVARLDILKNFGGIYLDTDTLILKKLDEFFVHETVIGWPPGEFIGTQIILSSKNSRFINMWLQGYQFYKPRQWYYNAGQFPTEYILQDHPYFVFRVPSLFGVQNLLDKLHGNASFFDWKDYYSLHLLARHEPTPKLLNEFTVLNLNSTFSKIAKWILYELNPKLNINENIKKWI